MFKNYIKKIISLMESLLTPFTLLSGVYLLLLRKMNLKNTPCNRKLLQKIGVLPVSAHYYEPLIRTESLRSSLMEKRHLPSIDFNDQGVSRFVNQLKLYSHELHKIPYNALDGQSRWGQFFWRNGAFETGDAEILYCYIRSLKPKKIIEIGAGYSTFVIELAATLNRQEGHPLQHICIEPYEFQALEKLGLPLTVIREVVEKCPSALFSELEANDLLFIDSSHVIRPGGDVLHELFEILPLLRPGVFVHFHDIFSPYDYPSEWVCDELKLWNEQYILEAFLSFNDKFKVMMPLHFWSKNYAEKLKEVCPIWYQERHLRSPGSFYIQRQQQ